MASTFKRINAVVVDPFTSKTRDAYADAGFAAGGAYVGNLATELNTTASTGACFRGMPVALSTTTGKIVPINQASTAAAAFAGVLIGDLTAYQVGRGTKIALATNGRIRSYAGGALTVGDPLKADTSAAFGGFVKWVSGTDSVDLRVGHFAGGLSDGSDGNAPVVTAAQGDQIFVDLL